MAVELDVHGLTKQQATKEIQRVIVANPTCDCIEVIHGFNNGRALKDYLRDKHNIHNSRVLKILPVPANDGRTLIFLKK